MSAANDAAIQRLTTALALGDGFQFHIVVCHSPRQVRNLIATLTQTVSARRGGSLRTEHLHPDSLRQRDQALDGDALTAYVTQALGGLARPAADERQLIVLDASFARQSDTPAWSLLFRRLNEQRNALAHALDAALLLCLTPHLEPIFAHEAPDFWSVRGVSVRLEPVREEEERDVRLSEIPYLRGQLQQASTMPDNLGGVDDAEFERLQAELPPLRAQVQAAKDDIDAIKRLSIILGRLGSHLVERDRHRDALAVYQEMLEIVERLACLLPNDFQVLSAQVLVHTAISSRLQALGEVGEAIEVSKKALVIARSLVAVAPDLPDHRRSLRVALSQFGNLGVLLGNDDEALSAYREAVTLAEDLARAAPERSEDQTALAITYGDLGAGLTSLHRYDEAQRYLEDALTIHEQLAMLEPGRLDYQQHLAKANQRLGDLFLQTGLLTRARACFEQAMAISERQDHLDPSRTDFLWHKVLLEVRLAQTEPGDPLKHLRRAFKLLTDFQARGGAADGLDVLMASLQWAIQTLQSPSEL
ncbi:MAG: tetratricopeptide repeat protein [Zoogloea sp.]|nr:tetratricopeptide repeat protein [Zoogloea sp.]